MRRPPTPKGPLRRVTEVIHPWTDIYTPIRVRLECGHEVLAWSDARAHCWKCRDGRPQDSPRD